MTRANLNWKQLGFGYMKTNHNIRYIWKDGAWDAGTLHAEDVLPMHMAATCLHYGQEIFEGLKVFAQKNGDITMFRADENARRMNRSAEKVFMQQVPEELFLDAIARVVRANWEYVPPYGTGASLYVRALLIGTGAQIGVKPADEYTFLVFVMPVGPYFKSGFEPIRLVVEEEFDRAAPNGVGDIKVGGNYAAGLRGSVKARAAGYTEALYLDAREKKYIEESGPANFFGITKDGQYVTPHSPSILPSITNMSLVQIAEDMGMRPVRRPVPVEEIFDFVDAGTCGTAAVITPVKSIAYRDREAVYCNGTQPGEYCAKLYQQLVAIQLGEVPDVYGWNRKITPP